MSKRIFLSVKFLGESNKKEVEAFAASLSEQGHDVFVPVRDISEWGLRELDYHRLMAGVKAAIGRCDVIVADVSEHGHGIAAEIGMAFMSGKSVVLVSTSERPISESLLGMADKVLRGRSYTDLLDRVVDAIQQ